MNNQRRKIINEAIAKLEEVGETISEVLDDEQDAYDNLPEGIQASDRGDTMETAISVLESAMPLFEQLAEELAEATH
jgi:DNA-binding protein H-NS